MQRSKISLQESHVAALNNKTLTRFLHDRRFHSILSFRLSKIKMPFGAIFYLSVESYSRLLWFCVTVALLAPLP